MDFNNTLIKPTSSNINSRKDVSLVVDIPELRFSGIPIIAANMDSVGTIDMAHALATHKISTALSKFISPDDILNATLIPEFTFITAGIREEGALYKLLDRMPNRSSIRICLDVANGYTDNFVRFVSRVKERYQDNIVMAGNVASYIGASRLFNAGADIVKVGIGPGELCTTRKVTGVGVPQIDAIIDCGQAAQNNLTRKFICADGGCRTPGDVAKAFCAGADFVMIGTMFAGHTESGATKDGVLAHGMSSVEAMQLHYGTIDTHRTAEGIQKFIPYRGSIHDTILHVLGGLRSACTYTNSHNIHELRNAELIASQ